MNKYQTYDIASKVSLVDEYLNRKQNGEKLTIASYSLEKQIPKTTFGDWVYKYKNSKNAFIYGTRDDSTVDLTPTITLTLIKISKEKLIEYSIQHKMY